MAVADFTEADLRNFLREEMDRSGHAVIGRQLQGGAASVAARATSLEGRATSLEARATALETVEALHVVGAVGEPAFQNAWVNFGGTEPGASFYKDRGRVYLAGSVKSGTLAAPIFTLPAGYRPPADTVRFAVIDGSGGPGGTVIVFANGNVQLQTGSNIYVSLAPVSFRVA